MGKQKPQVKFVDEFKKVADIPNNFFHFFRMSDRNIENKRILRTAKKKTQPQCILTGKTSSDSYPLGQR